MNLHPWSAVADWIGIIGGCCGVAAVLDGLRHRGRQRRIVRQELAAQEAARAAEFQAFLAEGEAAETSAIARAMADEARPPAGAVERYYRGRWS